MTTEILFYTIIALLIFEFALSEVLSYLNMKNFNPIIPKEFEGVYDAEKYKKSSEYEKEKYKFGLISGSFSFVLMLLLIIFGFFGGFDIFLRQYIANEILLGLVFFGLIGVGHTLLDIPFSYYATFILEEKYGFNKTTKKTFFTDIIKSLLLSAVIGGILLSLIIFVYLKIGTSFWIYAWIIMSAFSIFMMMFYSNIIVPLFNKQTPLEDGELKTAIEDFAKKVNFKLDNIYVMDGSKRSSKGNAYFTGLGSKKRIVLFDTLIADMTTDEIVAVLAHEIGHNKKKHTLQMLVFSLIQTGFMLYILGLALAIPEVSESLGATQTSFHIGIIAFSILFTPISMILGMISSIFSRKNEYEADAYSKANFSGDHLITALKKLSVNNLSNLTPHPAYEFFYYSHPTVLKRIEALRK